MSNYPANGTSLTVKQQRFVEEYCVDFNATQAAIRAGYSKNVPSEIGYENLRKPQIAKAIADRLDALSMSAEEALKRLTDMARASFLPFLEIDDEGRVRFNLGSDEAKMHFHLIRKIKSKRRTVAGDEWEMEWVEVELHDAKDAIDKILRARGVYVNRFEHGGSGGELLSPIQIEIVNRPRKTVGYDPI